MGGGGRVAPRRGLLVPRNVYRLVLQHCQDEVPLEACGIMTGVGEQVRAAYPMTNVRRSPVAYRIKEEEQLAAFHEMDERREELVAIYHSHPTTAARPSATDINMAYYPEALYIIISLTEATPAINAFRIVDGQAAQVPIAIGDGDGDWRDLREGGSFRRTVRNM